MTSSGFIKKNNAAQIYHTEEMILRYVIYCHILQALSSPLDGPFVSPYECSVLLSLKADVQHPGRWWMSGSKNSRRGMYTHNPSQLDASDCIDFTYDNILYIYYTYYVLCAYIIHVCVDLCILRVEYTTLVDRLIDGSRFMRAYVPAWI
jgi:hypothetical protein